MGKKTRTDIEWENRTLCSDESCIGVIGSDKRCKECGKPFEGEMPDMDSQISSDADYQEETLPPEDNIPEEDVTEAEENESYDNETWENRTLCSDESCIGVIGPDGRCKECGKPFEG